MRTWLAVGIGALLFAAGAEADDSRERWDDSHMQSRYTPTPPTQRPHFEGETGYAQLARGGSETRTKVPEQIEFTSQRQWVQGPLTVSATPGVEGAAGSSSFGSAGRSDGPPSSALRSGAVHSGSHGGSSIGR